MANQVTTTDEESEAQKLFEIMLPELTKENADRAIQYIAAGSYSGQIHIGAGLRLMKKICDWQMTIQTTETK